MVSPTLIACLCIFLSVAQGFETYLDRIPNADKLRQSNGLQEAVGHVNPAGDGARNQFGKDFATHGRSWNNVFCEADSDGDGLSNGEELGDPLCIWTKGDTPTRTIGITHPGICEPADSEKCLSSTATQPNVVEGSDESELLLFCDSNSKPAPPPVQPVPFPAPQPAPQPAPVPAPQPAPVPGRRPVGSSSGSNSDSGSNESS